MVLKRSILFFLILFLSMFSFNVSAADLSRITLSQACLDFPRISVYLDIRDSAEQEVTDIKSEQFNVSLGEYPLKVTGMTKWSDADEGIGYVMLVDVSRSLSPEQFKQMKLSVEDWIDSLQVKDRMAIISFGNQVNVVHDYTGDKAALKTVVADLVPVEDGTQFNAGIAKGLELSRLVSVGLPNRREIIVVSDGQEDYAGGVNRQEILRQIDEERIPIYAIGLYSPPNTPQKEEALKNMGEFARVSNGEFIKAESASLREISSYLHKAMSRGLILWLDCSNCKADGQLQRLQIKLNMHNTTLSQGMNLRLLHSNTPIEKKEGTRSFLESRPLWQYITSGVVLLLLIILTCYLFSRKRLAQVNSSPVVDVLTVYGGFDHEISQPVIPEVGIVKQDKKTTGLPIKLAVLGANNKGLPYYQLTLYDKTTIGRRSPADLIIENDEQISALHCEITLETGRVYIRDLGSTNGTMINGVPIAGKYCLQNEDLLLVGKTELRISLP